jgi:hypothetical protein
MRHEFNVLALVKGAEHYVYVFDDQSLDMTLAALRDHASDGELSLSWFDVAILAQKAREQAASPPARSDSVPSRLQG